MATKPISFTKMQGAGNDFIVLDETKGLLNLDAADYRWLADRHFGIGADQILSVRAAPSSDVDFAYVIHNADGNEVEHCGNGARCFMRFVQEQGLSQKNPIRVQTMKSVIALSSNAEGLVSVDMGAPVFSHDDIPFEANGLTFQGLNAWQQWEIGPAKAVAVLSMGNPHAVLVVDDVELAPVFDIGTALQKHPAFPNSVNVGFMQVLDAEHIKLRVFERGVGETLACGTGACAAVVAGIRLGLLAPSVSVQTRGGLLQLQWHGKTDLHGSVVLTGPAVTVFSAEIAIPQTKPSH